VSRPSLRLSGLIEADEDAAACWRSLRRLAL